MPGAHSQRHRFKLFGAAAWALRFFVVFPLEYDTYIHESAWSTQNLSVEHGAFSSYLYTWVSQHEVRAEEHFQASGVFRMPYSLPSPGNRCFITLGPCGLFWDFLGVDSSRKYSCILLPPLTMMSAGVCVVLVCVCPTMWKYYSVFTQSPKFIWVYSLGLWWIKLL